LKRLAFISSLLLLCSGIVFGALSPDERRANLESFDRVWNTVREKHWDSSLGGLDWDAVRAELRPRVEKAESDVEVRAIIGDMLARLHQSHFAVIPGSVYHDLENTHGPDADSAPTGNQPSEDGDAGFDIRVVDGQALVESVQQDSSAGRKGVRPGWIVRNIDDEDLAPILRRVGATYQNSTMRDMMLARAVTSRLEGPLGNPLEVEFRDGRDRSVALSLPRVPFRGQSAKFGYLPEEHMWIETRRAAPGVGYIAFNLFLDPARLVPAFQDAVRSCADCSGIVIDLRGNPGGIGILAMGLAGYFIDQPDQKLGTMQMRDLPLKFVVNPRPPVYHGKLAILLDGLSASTSEIFAGGLQDLKRARVFGSRSAGAALPSMIERLPNGDGFQYAAASYRSESGKTLEGNGVTPDETAPLTRAALLAGHDPALDAALNWIREAPSKGTDTP
jgi:carboxyl-terminal processing protease